MKNVMLGAMGAFIAIYTMMAGLGIYNTQTRYEEMENALSQIIKQTLEEGYGHGNVAARERQMQEDILQRMGSDSDVEIEVHCMDMEHGIISVTIRETFIQLNGQKKELEWTKTAIMDRKQTDIRTEEGVDYKNAGN